MKKIILSTLLLTALYSCKKEGQKTENTAASDSLSAAQPTAAEASTSIPKELSPENVSQYLAKIMILYMSRTFLQRGAAHA